MITRDLLHAPSVQQEIAALFADVGADVAMHAVALDTGRELDIGADKPVAIASTFKIPIMLAVAIDATEGRLDWDEVVTVTPDAHVPGGTGLSAFVNTAHVSLRDLALLMMSVSDNTATDILLERVSRARVNDLLQQLGLTRSVVVHDCGDVLGSIIADIGMEKLLGGFAALDPADLDGLEVLDPQRTNRSTARDITALLQLIWRDKAGSADACAEVRRIMSQQIWPHRLAAGVPDGAQYAGKTGTLPGRRHEAGVITLPDGSAYAIAVFTTAHNYGDNRPDIDAAIGHAGQLAVDALRVDD